MNHCKDCRKLIHRSVDEVLSGKERTSLNTHLDACAECRAELLACERTRAMVGALGRVAAPEDLALRLRVAVSQERTRKIDHRWNAWLTDMQASLNRIMVPATGGVLTA